jgi:hypothetical protein
MYIYMCVYDIYMMWSQAPQRRLWIWALHATKLTFGTSSNPALRRNTALSTRWRWIHTWRASGKSPKNIWMSVSLSGPKMGLSRYIFMHVCMHPCMYACVYMYACIYVFAYVCMCVCVFQVIMQVRENQT